MNEYTYQLRRKRRGRHCLINCTAWGRLCGCGARTPPGKRDGGRIVRRALGRELKRALEVPPR